MIEVFAFRHGQTDWNVLGKLQGHTDRPLSEVGTQQAQVLASHFARLGVEAILSSDLIRAAHTAQAIATLHKIPLHLDARLREARYGEAEGLTRQELVERYGEGAWEKWISTHPDHFDFSLPLGETRRQIVTRIQECVKDFAAQNPGLCRLGLSTHGGALKRLMGLAQNPVAGNFWIGNCEVHKLIFERNSGNWTYVEKVLEVET